MRKLSTAATVLLGLVLAVYILKLFSIYIIDEREQAVITRFNKPVRVIVGNISDEKFDVLRQRILDAARAEEGGKEPHISVSQGAGFYFRMPFIDKVERFPDILLETDASPRDVVLADKKKLMIDNFSRWYIENPLLYRIRVRTEGTARERLDYLIYSAMREELGRNELTEVVRSTNRFIDRKLEVEIEAPEEGGAPETTASENPMRAKIKLGREELMKLVSKRADEMAKELGIRIIDVRIKRADLLPENLQAVFKRMRAERSRISTGYRSEGQKQVDIIEGNTDRQVQILLAEAKRDGMKLQGEGDAEAADIYNQAFGANPEFYRFLRSLEVIQEATPIGSQFILTPDSSLYSALQAPPPAPAAIPAPAPEPEPVAIPVPEILPPPVAAP
jgi:membrane protease subunit HflC